MRPARRRLAAALAGLLLIACGTDNGSAPSPAASGGTAAGGELADTWIWNGSVWSMRSGSPAPSPRTNAALAFDLVRGRTVLFGGAGSTIVLDDTWTWDGKKWTREAPVHRPSARTLAAMAFDPVEGVTVLFGGDLYQGENQVGGDTWTWDGADWTQLLPATSPKRRFGASLVFDPDRRSLVLFGGHAGNAEYFNDTWTWTKGEWVPIGVGAVILSPRGEAAVGYDLKHGQLAVFGGVVHREAGPGAQGQPIGETWLLEHGTWSQRYPALSPSPRFAAASAYYAFGGLFLLFGGVTCPNLSDELWAWDGQTWSLYAPALRPPPRYGAAMVSDPVGGLVLLFGGSTSGCI